MPACPMCSAQLKEGEGVEFTAGAKAGSITVCHDCSFKLEDGLRKQTADANVAAGLGLGLLAAVVSSLVWYGVVVATGYELGLVAIGVGWLVSQAVMRGAGDKRGRALQAVAMVSVVVAMALSEFLIVRHFVNADLVQQGREAIPLLVNPLGALLLVAVGIQASPMSLLFWLIALYEGWRLPAASRLRRVEQAVAPGSRG